MKKKSEDPKSCNKKQGKTKVDLASTVLVITSFQFPVLAFFQRNLCSITDFRSVIGKSRTIVVEYDTSSMWSISGAFPSHSPFSGELF